MAQMIPPLFDVHLTPRGEQELFRRLSDDPDTKDWIVLHSLDIARHARQAAGEADFVVIVPGRGILCLEIKSHSHIERSDDGRWYFGTSGHGEIRGPFKQAAEARYSIQRYLADLMPSLADILFWSAVVFPRATFSARSPEWHSWQVVDSPDLRRDSIGHLLASILDRAAAHLRSLPLQPAWFRSGRWAPSVDQCAQIAAALRPRFECFESPKARALRRSEELKQYTDEQIHALDAMSANPRVVFSGPAGTGKTLLAIEATRRACEQGKRTLLLCFNRFLGQWLGEQTRYLGDSVHCQTIHSYMMGVSGISMPRKADRTFWHATLPALAAERLLEAEGPDGLYDELVIDEAQDVLHQSWLDVLDLSLKGGLAAGHWQMFGDFEKQAIYEGDISLSDFLSSRAGYPSHYALRDNCRNTPRISVLVQQLSGLNPGYRLVRRPDDTRIDPRTHIYRDAAEQRALLVEILEYLWNEGYRGSDIVVLSPINSGACASTIQSQPWGDRLKPFSLAGTGHIGYCTVQAFKGLEAPVVILTDIDRCEDDASRALLYIGLSRALERVEILAHAAIGESLARAALSSYSGTTGTES